MCSGSLITSKHILTSAECLLKNKDEIENQKQNKKVKPEYNKKECFYVIHGFMDKSSANTDRYLLPIKNHFVHGHAFTDVKEFNNNLAILELLRTIDFSKTRKPICMPHWASRPLATPHTTPHKGVIAGWGWDGEAWGNHLKEVA